MSSNVIPLSSRLPIDHPNYEYPPSRNPYWKKLQEFAGRVFWDNETEKSSGRWLECFPDALKTDKKPRELHVEIGCNAGHVVIEWAARNPEAAYIGIDWKFKPICWAMEKATKREISNILFFRAHAERLRYMFGPGEIDRLSLFFPDPWPRKSQWKNRFLTAERLKDAAFVVRQGGIFHIKTDHRGYFDWMEDALKTLQSDPETAKLWEVAERSTDLHATHPNPKQLQIPDVTLFERLFIKDGIPINSLVLRRL